MNYLILILFTIPCILLNINLLFAGGPIYNFHRNLFKSRIIQMTYIASISIAFLSLIYFRFIDIWNRIKLKDLMIVLVLILLLGLMTIFTYLRLGEGVFTNGVIFKGIFTPWKYIKNYKIESKYNEDSFLLVLYIEDNERTATRRFILGKHFETDLNIALSRFITIIN